MEDKKNLQVSRQNQNSVQLHDNGLRSGSLIEQAVSKLTEQQAQNLMTKAGDEALRLEVKNREQNLDYVVGKKVTEDHIGAFEMLDKSGKLTRHSVTTDIKTGAGNMRIESRSGATCFVASVAYGNPNHPDVMFLRSYRDNTLNNSIAGRKFIAWYWKVGPKLARVVSKSWLLRNVVKLLISKIVSALR